MVILSVVHRVLAYAHFLEARDFSVNQEQPTGDDLQASISQNRPGIEWPPFKPGATAWQLPRHRTRTQHDPGNFHRFFRPQHPPLI